MLLQRVAGRLLDQRRVRRATAAEKAAAAELLRMVRGDDAMVVPGVRVDSEGALPSTVQRGGSAGSSLERVSAGKFACLQCNSALTFIAFAQGAGCSWCKFRFCSADCRHKHDERCARSWEHMLVLSQAS